MGNSSKKQKHYRQQTQLRLKQCTHCAFYKKYKHCCLSECFNDRIFNGNEFVDVMETRWSFTIKHEVELNIILIPLGLRSIISIIKLYLSHTKQNKQKRKTCILDEMIKTKNKSKNIERRHSKKLSLLAIDNERIRASSVPEYTDMERNGVNIENSEHLIYHAYYHGYISLYNNNMPPCVMWLNSLDDNYEYKGFKEIKITVFGDAGVGKTSLINRYITNKFEDYYETTIEDLYFKRLYWNINDNNYPNVCLSLMDTAGGDMLNSCSSDDNFVKWIDNSDVILLCFDVMKPFTFNYIKEFLIPRIQKHFENKNENGIKYVLHDGNNNIAISPKNKKKTKKQKLIHNGPVTLILVGNKCDLRYTYSSTNNNEFMDDTRISKNKMDNKYYNDMYKTVMKLAKLYNIPYIETSSKDNKNITFLFKQCIYEYWIQSQTNCIQWKL